MGSGTRTTMVNYDFRRRASAGSSLPAAFLTFSVAISESRCSTEGHCILSKSRQEFEKHPMVQVFVA